MKVPTKLKKKLQLTLYKIYEIECLHPKFKNKSRLPSLTTAIQYLLDILSSLVREEKEIQVEEEEIKRSLFSNNIIVCVENPKESTTKLLQLISEFSKVT